MIGVSIYLGRQTVGEQARFLDRMEGVASCIFTSLHIPEDNAEESVSGLKALGEQAKERNLKLMVDISADSLEKIGLRWEDADQLKDWGVTGLRIDDGVPPGVIAKLSHFLTIGLNASTITEEELKQMDWAGLDRANTEAWHNFYPRPNTGLPNKWFKERNEWLHQQRIRTVAFVPGNEMMRGPLYEGLPTLEAHRGASPFAAYVELTERFHVDQVVIGDSTVTNDTIDQFYTRQNGAMPVRYVRAVAEQSHAVMDLLHCTRPDPSRDVIRSADSRPYIKRNQWNVRPFHTIERKKGAITLDNERYGRYEGELHIVLNDLPAHEATNVIGHVVPEDLPLLACIKPATVLKFVEVK